MDTSTHTDRTIDYDAGDDSIVPETSVHHSSFSSESSSALKAPVPLPELSSSSSSSGTRESPAPTRTEEPFSLEKASALKGPAASSTDESTSSLSSSFSSKSEPSTDATRRASSSSSSSSESETEPESEDTRNRSYGLLVGPYRIITLPKPQREEEPHQSPLRSSHQSPLRLPLQSPLRSPHQLPLRSPHQSPLRSPPGTGATMTQSAFSESPSLFSSECEPEPESAAAQTSSELEHSPRRPRCRQRQQRNPVRVRPLCRCTHCSTLVVNLPRHWRHVHHKEPPAKPITVKSRAGHRYRECPVEGCHKAVARLAQHLSVVHKIPAGTMRKELVKQGRTFQELHTGGGQPQIWPPLDPIRAVTQGRKTRLEKMMRRPSSSSAFSSSSSSSDDSPERRRPPPGGAEKRKSGDWLSHSRHPKRRRLTYTTSPEKTTADSALRERHTDSSGELGQARTLESSSSPAQSPEVPSDVTGFMTVPLL
ncbi:uncharacterized protein LOC130048389 [Ostrea edulis]|uniref:uncharacterized protein LOC130048389 n=1 Tax=Ostrea edulis TaxID=37623 RepID=UPI0024AF2D73|nr:uncharacterized protein LOC130048389 [Ostrea edulis]